MVRRGRNRAIPGDHQRLGHQGPDLIARLPGARDVQPLQRRIVADEVGRLPGRDLPDDVAAIQVDGADRGVGRLQQRQAVHRQAARTAGGRRGLGRRRRIGPLVITRPPDHRHPLAGHAHDVVHIRQPRRRLLQPIGSQAGVAGEQVGDVGLRIERPARPVGPALRRIAEQPQRPRLGRDHRRGIDRPQLVVLRQRQRLGLQFRREVDQVALGDTIARIGGRPGRDRLGGGVPLAGYVALRNLGLLDRPHRLAGGAVEHIEEPLLRRQRHRLDRLAGHRDVHQQRRRGIVVVPQLVVDQLVVPLALAGGQVHRHQAVAVQSVPRPVPAIEIPRRRLHRQIGQVQPLIDRDLGPDAGVASILR